MIRRYLAAALALGLTLTALADESPPRPRMANYQFGLLTRGPSWTPERTPRSDSIQAGHMANIQRMFDLGVLLVSGPIGDRGDLRGIFIFRADSVARLRELVARDPAVSSGRLVLDLHSWFAPAGIGEPYRRMAQQPGHRDSMVRLQLVLLRSGPRLAQETAAENKAALAGHETATLRGLASGEIAAAGPLIDSGALQGVLVYRGDSTQAHMRALADPAVKAGHFAIEMHPWFAAYGTMPGDTLAGAK